MTTDSQEEALCDGMQVYAAWILTTHVELRNKLILIIYKQTWAATSEEEEIRLFYSSLASGIVLMVSEQ